MSGIKEKWFDFVLIHQCFSGVWPWNWIFPEQMWQTSLHQITKCIRKCLGWISFCFTASSIICNVILFWFTWYHFLSSGTAYSYPFYFIFILMLLFLSVIFKQYFVLTIYRYKRTCMKYDFESDLRSCHTTTYHHSNIIGLLILINSFV